MKFDIKAQTKEELRTKAAELAEEIRALQMGLATATFKKSHEVSALKKQRAQILTFLDDAGTLTRH